MLQPQEIIRSIRDKSNLPDEEFAHFFKGYLEGQVTDYQMSAMLMAIYLNGIPAEKTVQLTKLSRDSGEVFDWPYNEPIVADKHSTGGVGDKTSLIILPLAILAGLKVPMMSGRGLGHTGGTLDKLESIPGTNVFLERNAVRELVDSLGGAFLGQTENIAALDRRLYSLRDVTSTVESVPLITASILSKKLAEGLNHLVLDIKFGSGAFMAEIEDSRHLAENLVKVGSQCGMNVKALMTSMNSVLGHNAGNSLEIIEVIDVLKGRGPWDTKELSIELTAEMVQMAYPDKSYDAIKSELEGYLDSGQAFELFKKLIEKQGGDPRYLDEPERFEKAPVIKPVLAQSQGFIQKMDVRSLGIAVLSLGGGRVKITDEIDPRVGLSHLKRVGESVTANEEILFVHAKTEKAADEVVEICRNAITIDEEKPSDEPLILDRIG